MTMFRSGKVVLTTLLMSSMFLLNCSKKQSPSPTPETPNNPAPEKPNDQPRFVTEQKDVTNMGILTVNIESANGKDAIEGSSKLIDNNINTKFYIGNYAKTFFAQLTFTEAKQIGSYIITSGNDASQRDPVSWTITASVDGTTWVELNSHVYEFFPGRTQSKTYHFKNNKFYKYYRLNVTQVNGSALQLTEWRMIEVPISKQTDNPISKVQTIVHGKNTLTYVDKTVGFNQSITDGLINVFKVNYQKLADIYNPNATDKIVFVIEPGYEGVAAAFGGAIIRYDPEWFMSNPRAWDVATHEMMHVIQSYPHVPNAGWVTEGIADYVRYTMGVYNDVEKFDLPAFSSSQKYTDSYRVTARFLFWLEKNSYQGIVVKLDDSMRRGVYTTDAFWTANTGKTIDQLWADYAASPGI